MKAAVGSDLSLVSGNYYEDGETVVMDMASFYVKIRHDFWTLFCLKNDRSTFSSNIIAQWLFYIECQILFILASYWLRT